MSRRCRRSWIVTALLVLPGCFDPGLAPGPGGENDEETVGPGPSGPASETDPDGMPGPTGDDDETAGGDEASGDETGGDEVPGDASDGTSDSGDSGDSIDPDDSGATSSSSESGDTEPVAPEPCGGGAGVCVATPGGWSGPIRVIETDVGAAPDCGGAEIMVSANTDLAAPPASCTCECDPAVGASCSTATLTAWGDDGTCSEDSGFTQELDEDCTLLNGVAEDPPLEGLNYWSVTTETTGGNCAPDASQSVVPAAYDGEVHGCEVAELDMPCGVDEACYEADAPLCVWRDGNHPCPEGDFSVRTLHYRGDPVDTRTCSPCTCGSAEGSCPATTIDMFQGYYCAAPSVGELNGACEGLCAGTGCETYALSAVVDLGAGVASCDPQGGNPIGSVTQTDPVTFCCAG